MIERYLYTNLGINGSTTKGYSNILQFEVTPLEKSTSLKEEGNKMEIYNYNVMGCFILLVLVIFFSSKKKEVDKNG